MNEHGNSEVEDSVTSKNESTSAKKEEGEEPVKTLPKAQEVKELPKEVGKTVEQFEQELSKERKRAEEYFKQLQYLQADFDNYRKRVEKEMAEVKQTSNESLVKSLLGVLDELGLCTDIAKKTNDVEGMLKGVEMVLKNLYSILESQGLSHIEAVGSRFDPIRHEAAERVLDANHTEGTVVGEIRKGFTFKGRVIRPSLVKVAVNPITSKTLEEKAL